MPRIEAHLTVLGSGLEPGPTGDSLHEFEPSEDDEAR